MPSGRDAVVIETVPADTVRVSVFVVVSCASAKEHRDKTNIMKKATTPFDILTVFPFQDLLLFRFVESQKP